MLNEHLTELQKDPEYLKVLLVTTRERLVSALMSLSEVEAALVLEMQKTEALTKELAKQK